jgi:hypothetical protein
MENEKQSEKNRSKQGGEKYNTEKNRMDYEGGNQGEDNVNPDTDRDDSDSKQSSSTISDRDSDS